MDLFNTGGNVGLDDIVGGAETLVSNDVAGATNELQVEPKLEHKPSHIQALVQFEKSDSESEEDSQYKEDLLAGFEDEFHEQRWHFMTERSRDMSELDYK